MRCGPAWCATEWQEAWQGNEGIVYHWLCDLNGTLVIMCVCFPIDFGLCIWYIEPSRRGPWEMCWTRSSSSVT